MEVHIGSVVLLSVCAMFDTHGVWWLQTMRLELQYTFFFSEQSSNLSFSLLKPAHRGHTANSDVENCVSVLEKLRDGSYCIQHMRQEAYQKNFWKIWFHVCFMNQSIKTGCYINFPWSNMYTWAWNQEMYSSEIPWMTFLYNPRVTWEAKSCIK